MGAVHPLSWGWVHSMGLQGCPSWGSICTLAPRTIVTPLLFILSGCSAGPLSVYRSRTLWVFQVLICHLLGTMPMLHMVFICCPFCVPSTVSLSSWGLLPLFPFCLTSSLLILSLHVTPSVRCAPPIVSYSRLLFSKFQLHVAVLVKPVSCLTIICFSAQSFVLLNILESSRHRICLSSSCSSHSCPCQWQSFPSRRNVLPSQYFFLLPILLCHCELDIFHWFFLHSFRTVCFHLYVICDLP